MVTSCRWKAYTGENKMYKCWVLRDRNRITPITGTGWSFNNVVTAYGHIPLTVQSHLWTSAGRSVTSCTHQSHVQHAFSLPPVSAHSISRTFPETNNRTPTNSGISPISVSVCVEQLASWLGFWLNLNMWTATTDIPYILESNPHSFYSFRGLKNQMRIRIACGLDSRSRAGFWKNDRAAVLYGR